MTVALARWYGASSLPARAAALGALVCAGIVAAMPFTGTALVAWLPVAVLWSAVPIGGAGLLAMMRLIPGRWNVEPAIFVEATILLLPLAALSLLPILFGMGGLYPTVEEAEVGAFHHAYRQPWLFWLRSAAWLALVGGLGWLLVTRRGRSKAVASVGLVAYPVLGTMVAVDWLMSLEPDFHSSGFGLYVLSIQMAVALLAACLALLVVHGRPPRSGLVGALVLTALLVWGYLAYMQYFIIWSGDQPHGVSWYQVRSRGAWQGVVWAIIAAHAVPVALLLSARIRRHRAWLMGLLGLAFVGKGLEAAWLVLPTLPPDETAAGIGLTIAGHVGLGLVTIAAYALAIDHRIRRRAPVAQDSTR